MLTAPVLQLDAAAVKEIDPRNVESLFGMWTGTEAPARDSGDRLLTSAVFSRCAPTIRQGRRYENVAWRLWAHQTLCCPPQPENIIVPSIEASPPISSGVPSLSNSMSSDTSTADMNSFTFSRRERTRKLSELEGSALSKSRGKECHLTTEALTKIVTNIQDSPKLEPLSPSIEAVVNAKMQAASPGVSHAGPDFTPPSRTLPYSTDSSCISTVTATTVASTARQAEHRDSETSVSSTDGDGLIYSGSVVKGFSPAAASSFRSSKVRLSHGQPPSIMKHSPARTLVPGKPHVFTLGGSSEEDESSFEQRMSYKKPLPNKRQSSLSQSLGKNLGQQKKVTSFRDIVEQRKIQESTENDEDAIASSDSEDDEAIDSAIDSAIDDDDSEEGEWEDSNSDDGRNHHNNANDKEPVFRRIDSRPNLTSRRSVLTQGLTEGERAQGLVNEASKSSPAIRRTRTASHNGPSIPGSPEKDEEDNGGGGMMMQPARGAKPLPIIPTTSNTYAMAHSPRTTRRNMLSTELTSSLRKNLLWERQNQKSTVNAFARRQAQSMANLQKAGVNAAAAAAAAAGPSGDGTGNQPETENAWKPNMSNKEETVAAKNNSWTFEMPWEYNAKGW